VLFCSSSLLIREPQPCPLSGRDSTHRPVWNCGATSEHGSPLREKDQQDIDILRSYLAREM